MRYYLTFVLLMIFGVTTAQKKPTTTNHSYLDIHNAYLKEAFVLTKNCVGFSAPISGRAYGYLAVGMYEASVPLTGLQSLEGQLNAFHPSRTVVDSSELQWGLVLNESNYQIMAYLHRGMPPSNRERLDLLHDSISKHYARRTKKKMRMRSIAYGQAIANDIITWSKSDGGDEGYLNNFPEDFEPKECPSCWEKTFPGYLSALVPYWGDNRPMLPSALATVQDMEIFPFSTDSSSVMFQEAWAVYENSQRDDPEFEVIAEYWNDGAGRSGTPAGHFFTLARNIAIQEQLDLDKALELYAKLGIAINDAFIASFQLKYKFNFIRPITYIHRHIDSQFNSRLSSPPFPEYPSGHSLQSGAATEVMKSIFGDALMFTDVTNASRTDINGSPRSYTSFTEMSEEISVSRFYGGIHFMKTLDESLKYGRKIGISVATSIQCR